MYIKDQILINQEKYGHIINQYDKNNNYIKTFPSAWAAISEINPKMKSSGAVGHIMDVCKGKRKTAYGYIWKFHNIN